MKMLRQLVLAVLIGLVVSQECSETYTPWLLRGSCNDTCGGYGLQKMVRSCQSGCSCLGPYLQWVLCGDTLCEFPRATCAVANGIKKVIVGTKYVCGYQKGQ